MRARDPFAGYNFIGTDDEEDSTKSKRNQRTGPPRKWGSPKKAESNVRPTGYANAEDRSEGYINNQIPTNTDDTLVKAGQEFLNRKLRPEDLIELNKEELGEGVPLTKAGAPATKDMLVNGAKTQQRRGSLPSTALDRCHVFARTHQQAP